MQRLADITDGPTAWQALSQMALMRAGGLALDIGANTGQACHLLAPCFDRVIAFEPAEESASMLMGECADNVEVRTVAVSAESGVVDLDVADQAIGYGQLVSACALDGHPEWGRVIGTREVLATTVDEVVGAEGVLPAMVKVDTEGHEVPVVEGAEHTIALGYTSWFIEVHAGAHEQPVRNVFNNFGGYVIERIENDYLVPFPTRAAEHFYLVARPK